VTAQAAAILARANPKGRRKALQDRSVAVERLNAESSIGGDLHHERSVRLYCDLA
jgi:hypothetical protein